MSGVTSLRRTVGAGAAVVLLVFVGMSAIALMALPVEQGVPMSVDNQTSGYGTPLGGEWIEAPVLGVVDALTGGFAGELLGYAVAIVATLVLSQAANAGMVGIARTSYTLAVHRQIPRGVARLHPKYGTPWIVLADLHACWPGCCCCRSTSSCWPGMFAYGALIAFALAHLSVCVLRFKEPDRPRAYRVPLNVRIRGRDLPLPAAFGAVASVAAWVATFIYHDDARLFGSIWMVVGLLVYVGYRSREGLSLTRRVEVPAERMSQEPEVEYARSLVPVFGEELDDDIMSTAGQLASGDRGGATIDAIYVIEVPMSLPLDAHMPLEKLARAEEALRRAKRVGEEYEGVQVRTEVVRGRTVGSAIVEAARARGVEVIVIGAEPPSRIKGGGVLGGIVGGRPQEVGEVTAYVLEKSPVRVLVTAPPDRDVSAESLDDTDPDLELGVTAR